MIQSYFLSSCVFRTRTPDDRAAREMMALRMGDRSECSYHALLHLFRDLLMYRVAKVLHGAFSATQHDRLTVIRCQAARFGIYAHQIESLPHSLDELIDVEPFLGGNGYALGDFIPGKKKAGCDETSSRKAQMAHEQQIEFLD